MSENIIAPLEQAHHRHNYEPSRGRGGGGWGGSTAVMSSNGRLGAAGLVAITLVLAIIGFTFKLELLRGTTISIFMLIELGIAPCLMMQAMPAMWFILMSVASSLATTIALGFLMSVTHIWHPMIMFGLVLVATVGMLTSAVSRDLGRRLRPKHTMKSSFTTRWLAPGYIVTGVTAAGVLVVGGDALIQRTAPQPVGLFGTVGVAWYIGLAMIVGSAVWAKKSGTSVAFPVLCLASIVVLSQAISYGAPAVMTAARHLGFVDFIRVHHGAQPRLDIYQAWSGLFAGIAWLADVAGIVDPLPVATWWPVLLAPATALAVAALASRWITGSFRIWFAAAVFGLTGTALNITYFSPQSVGLFLALTIFALSASRSTEPDRRSEDNPTQTPYDLRAPESHELKGRVVLRWIYRVSTITHPLGIGRVAFIFYLACVMAVTHQISPYLTVAALVALCLFRLLRPWWIFLLVLAPAIGWALLNRGVLGGFISLGAVGRLWDNVQPPTHSFTQFAQPEVTRLAFYAPAGMLVIVGIVALANVLIGRRQRYIWALLLATASPATLFLATDYGQEGIFRVTLFSGPWLAILAAGVTWKRPRWSGHAFAISLILMLGTNVYGQTALDWNRVISPDTAQATLLYERSAAKGATLLLTGTGNASPLGQTARYLDVEYLSREALGGYPPVDQPYNASTDVENMTKTLVRDWPSPQYYALVSNSIGAYDDRYGFQHYSDYVKLAAAMAKSPLWQPILSGSTATLYVMTDRVAQQLRP